MLEQQLYPTCTIYYVLFLTGSHTCGVVVAATHVKNSPVASENRTQIKVDLFS